MSQTYLSIFKGRTFSFRISILRDICFSSHLCLQTRPLTMDGTGILAVVSLASSSLYCILFLVVRVVFAALVMLPSSYMLPVTSPPAYNGGVFVSLFL